MYLAPLSHLCSSLELQWHYIYTNSYPFLKILTHTILSIAPFSGLFDNLPLCSTASTLAHSMGLLPRASDCYYSAFFLAIYGRITYPIIECHVLRFLCPASPPLHGKENIWVHACLTMPKLVQSSYTSNTPRYIFAVRTCTTSNSSTTTFFLVASPCFSRML